MATSDEAPRRTWPLPVAGALGSVIALGVTYLAYVHTETGQRAENGAVHQAQTAGVADPAFSALLKGGAGTVLLASVAVLALVVGVVRARLAGALAVLGVIGGSVGLTELLKVSVLDRPDLYDTSVAGHNSFPSGHVTAAMSVLVAFALVSPRKVRPLVLGGGSVAVAAVAIATVALGWHRLSDTLGGCLVPAVLGCLVATWLGRTRAHPHPAWFVAALVVPSIVPIAGRLALGSATSFAERLDTSIMLAGAGAPAVAIALVALLHGVDLAKAVNATPAEREESEPRGRHHLGDRWITGRHSMDASGA
ncbi:phosphatase PAP2 family protein [Allokutzneria oryzae]|uniref:Phosphatase PAP2 family protein n=1 Tax=Allokutzneria oryzae TaxID=1378989 RepID=A0ABV5ZQ25_9PSEU